MRMGSPREFTGKRGPGLSPPLVAQQGRRLHHRAAARLLATTRPIAGGVGRDRAGNDGPNSAVEEWLSWCAILRCALSTCSQAVTLAEFSIIKKREKNKYTQVAEDSPFISQSVSQLERSRLRVAFDVLPPQAKVPGGRKPRWRACGVASCASRAIRRGRGRPLLPRPSQSNGWWASWVSPPRSSGSTQETTVSGSRATRSIRTSQRAPSRRLARGLKPLRPISDRAAQRSSPRLAPLPAQASGISVRLFQARDCKILLLPHACRFVFWATACRGSRALVSPPACV